MMKQIEQYGIFELIIKGREPEGSHVEVDIQAEFASDDCKLNIKGFYNGNGEYRIRFMPQQIGVWTYKVRSEYADPVEGTFECVLASGNNHGPVITEGMGFRYADGTRYHPFGTTCYAWTHQPREQVEQTKLTLAASPFNKLRMCIFPKSMEYNHNDPELYPFTKKPDGSWDVHHPDFEFWEYFEEQIGALMEMGIEADLILFHPYDRWGFSSMCREEDLVYLDYCVRRLSAYRNVWWSLANEYDLMDAKNSDDWEAFGSFIRREDPYHHLVSVHNCLPLYDFSKPWVTHCSIQSSFLHMIYSWREIYRKPVIIDECGYEGTIEEGWGNLSAFEMTHRFWECITNGAYCTHGETIYREDEVLWWAKGGALYGESAERIRFLREIVSSIPGELQPEQRRLLDPNDPQMQIDIKNNPFIKGMAQMTEGDRELILFRLKPSVVQCGDDCHLIYLGRSCMHVCTLDLPDNAHYAVDVIDIWNMTRQTVIPDASGKTRVPLPAREGMAIMATRKG